MIQHLLQTYGYLAVPLLFGLESLGIPLPGPGNRPPRRWTFPDSSRKRGTPVQEVGVASNSTTERRAQAEVGA